MLKVAAQPRNVAIAPRALRTDVARVLMIGVVYYPSRGARQIGWELGEDIVAGSILVRNNVKVFGQGAQPMLFAHGFGCDQNMWRFVTPAFEDEYRVVLFDYVGSGKSDLRAYSPERYGNLDGYAQDVLNICAALDLRTSSSSATR